MKTKTIAMILAMVMMVVGLVGATLAWLTDKTSTITNTFTTSNISVTLEETKGENDGTNAKKFQMIPGYTIEKDPKATVVEGSEECWLFVKVEKSDNFDIYMTYQMADGWESVEGATNVYARKVKSADIGTPYSVLKDDQVTVNGTVTKDMMDAIEKGTVAKPTLKFTAYASQLYKNAGEEFTAAQAWANVNSSTSSST